MNTATAPMTATESQGQEQTVPLHSQVTETIQGMLTNMGSGNTNVYRDFLEQVEIPLLRAVMTHTKNNQVRAAKLLGISRGTLRTKLKKYFGTEYCETRSADE